MPDILGAPDEVVAGFLRRIEAENAALNAFLDVDTENALAAARASTARFAAGAPLSPIDGMAIGVKANIAVAGLPWHAGIGAYRSRIATEDAACVAQLRAAGAIILGTLNMHEAALGATNDNEVFGRCHNPHRHGFTPGGSSGGSAAAVAAGLCAAALGTDTMGSVRIPAAYCGVFGHMPGFGSILAEDIVPLSWTLDHVGILGRTSADILSVLSVLAPGPVRTGKNIAVLDLAGRTEVDQSVTTAFAATVEAARAAGFTTTRIDLPEYDPAAMRRICLLIAEAEAYVTHEAALTANPEGFSSPLRAMLNWAARQPAPKLSSAYRQLALTGAKIRAALAPFDALLTPTTGTPAFPFEAPAPASQADFTLLANIAHLEATAFPIGTTPDGMPLSAQFLSFDAGLSLTLATALTQQ
jgi:aspartyl-tRNA(Asn)/glutamyl-tRNA(Gln) amidotransferase subunit A